MRKFPTFGPTSGPPSEWLEATADVTPIGQAPQGAPKLPKMPAPTGATPNAPHPTYITPHWRSTPLPILTNTAQQQAGKAPELPAKTLKALASGQLPPQATLDLHGLREGDAWLRLHHFLTEAAKAEHGNSAIQVVLIIHGKGRGEGLNRDMGTLKSQMPAQLARHPAVVAFHTAPPVWGGMGAMLVLLKNS